LAKWGTNYGNDIILANMAQVPPGYAHGGGTGATSSAALNMRTHYF